MNKLTQENAKQHNSLYPMPNDVLVKCLKDMLNPGNIPMGIPFGWIQPDENDTITLGSVYAQCPNAQTWLDVIKQYNQEERFSIIRLIRQAKKEKEYQDFREYIENKRINLDGIYECENVNTSYSILESHHKCLYRLAILNLNTMTDGHNCAIELLNSLAMYYCQQSGYESSSESGFRLYENDRNSTNIELLGEILESFENKLSFYIGSDNFYESYHVKNLKEESLPEILEYIESKEESYQDTLDENDDLIFSIFNESVNQYDRDFILAYTSFSLSEIKKAYLEGRFFFTSIPDNIIKSSSLYKFLFSYFHQPSLFR